jgi:hypothetical protein
MNSLTCLTSIVPNLSARYDHRSKKSQYCGLHTVTYRVLNFVQRYVLEHGLSDGFRINMHSGQNKSMADNNDLVWVRLSYGRGIVEVDGNRILFICENTRTIHHIDDNGVYSHVDYTQNFDVSDVIARVAEKLEIIKANFKPEPKRHVAMQHDWELVQEFGTKPTIKPLARYTRTCKVKGLTTSKNWEAWTGVYRDRNNRNYTKRENIGYPKAYKVEIDGVVAWLPHSILGVDSPVFNFSTRHPVVELSVPTWWYRNNIKNGQKMSA